MHSSSTTTATGRLALKRSHALAASTGAIRWSSAAIPAASSATACSSPASVASRPVQRRRTRCATPAMETAPPGQPLADVEHPGGHGVGAAAAIKARRAASPVSASGQADRQVPSQAPAAPAASTAARLRGEATLRRPAPAPSRRPGRRRAAAASRAWSPRVHHPGAAGHQHVQPGVLCAPGGLGVVDLRGGADSGRVGALNPGQVGAEADREQRGRAASAASNRSGWSRITQSTKPIPNLACPARSSSVANDAAVAVLPIPIMPSPPAAVTAAASRPPATLPSAR